MSRSTMMLVALALLAGCGEPTDPLFSSTSQARVRFVNATSETAALNFAVNGQPAAQSIAFGAPSPCQPLSAGAAAFTASTVGSTAAFGAGLNQTLPASGRFAVIATGSASDPQFLFLDNAVTPAVAGRARVRIINAVPGFTPVDVFITAPNAALGTALASNVGFNAATTFLDVPAGQSQIRFTAAGTQTVTFQGAPFNLTSGETTTVVVAPGVTPGTFRVFAVQPC